MPSLEAILRRDENVLHDPESQIPLPDSRTTSLLSTAELGSQNTQRPRIRGEPRSSLDIITQNGVFPSPHTLFPATIPLPESRSGSLDESRSPQLVTQPEAGGQRQGQPYPSHEHHSRLRRPRVQEFVYDDIIERASEILPHLESGRIQSTSRHDVLDITCLDYSPSFCLQPVVYDDVRDDHPFNGLGEIPDNVKQWLLIVQDLSPSTINCLWARFGVNPEFFEEHLINSGYEDGNYADAPSQSWTTSGMKKTYVSMRWYRPVVRLPVGPYSKQDLVSLFDYTPSKFKDLITFKYSNRSITDFGSTVKRSSGSGT